MFWLLQSLSLVSCLGSGNAVLQSNSTQFLLNGVLGESITFQLNFPARERLQMVLWHHSGAIIATTQRDEVGSLHFSSHPSKLKERLNITQSSLHLSNLTMADAGSYRVHIITNTSQTSHTYTLRIFRRLRNLQVTHYVRLPGDGTCEIHLNCSVENPNDALLFGWQASGNISLGELNLTISWDPKASSGHSYICIAENPVSKLSFSVSALSLCKGF
ncbi:SLAM family member 6 [Ctenodactylus gundi]